MHLTLSEVCTTARSSTWKRCLLKLKQRKNEQRRKLGIGMSPSLPLNLFIKVPTHRRRCWLFGAGGGIPPPGAAASAGVG